MKGACEALFARELKESRHHYMLHTRLKQMKIDISQFIENIGQLGKLADIKVCTVEC
jgi:hypothetical protein